MTKHIIGIDGGGTKTKFALYHHKGDLIKEVTKPTCHFMQVSKTDMMTILQAGVNDLLETNDYLREDLIICAGMAGYGQNKQVRKLIEEVFFMTFPNINVKLYSDAEIAVSGALGGQDGIVIIAGTGSIALKKEQGQFYRVGGWGYLLGDEGSSYWVGKQALSVFCKQADGRMKKSYLYDEIMNYYELNQAYELIMTAERLLKDRTNVADLARVCYSAAKKGDLSAKAIFEDTAKELASLVKVLAGNQKNISYVGGLFNSKDILLPLLEQELGNEYQISAPIDSPEKGAYYLAKK